MAGGIIPKTPLRKLYNWLRAYPSGTNISGDVVHRSLLAYFQDNPRKLVSLMRTSVEQFQQFNNLNEPFHPPRRGDKFLKSKADGTVRFQQAALRTEKFECRVNQSARVGYQFVDRELGTDRVTQEAGVWRYANGNAGSFSGRGGIDLLLRADLPNGQILPAICELKIGDDSTPFLALIQALTYAAELATPSQFQRLKNHYPEFAAIEGDPKVHVCLFSSATPKRQIPLLNDTRLLVDKLFDKRNSIRAIVAQIVIAKCAVSDGQFRLDEATLHGGA